MRGGLWLPNLKESRIDLVDLFLDFSRSRRNCLLNKNREILLALIIMVSGAAVMQANSLGAQSFADVGSPVADTGNINTATTFTIGDLMSTSANAGYLAGMPKLDFGSVTFNSDDGSSLSFGDSFFGSFVSSSITEIQSGPGMVGFYVLGLYSGGTYDPGIVGDLASLTISFTQTPSVTGVISDSASFADPPAPEPGSAPEPTTLTLMGSALVGGFALFQRRRRT